MILKYFDLILFKILFIVWHSQTMDCVLPMTVYCLLSQHVLNSSIIATLPSIFVLQLFFKVTAVWIYLFCILSLLTPCEVAGWFASLFFVFLGGVSCLVWVGWVFCFILFAWFDLFFMSEVLVLYSNQSWLPWLSLFRMASTFPLILVGIRHRKN